MQVEFVMMADAAQVVGGKLYLLGGAWNVFGSASFPAQANIAFAASILVDWDETGTKHPVTLTLAGEDGIPLIPTIEGGVEVGRPEGQNQKRQQRALFALNVTVLFPRAGRYSLVVAAGNDSKTVTFDVTFVGTKVELAPGSPTH